MPSHPRRFVALCGFVLCFATLFSAIGRADDNAKFRWSDGPEPGVTDLLLGDKPALRYMGVPYDTSSKERTDATFKVFHHVFAPDGKTLLTQGTGGKQFPHHRGLYVAWNKTSWDGGAADFWHCTKGARQEHVKFVNRAGDEQHGTATTEIHWNDAEGKAVVIETRGVDVRRSPAGTAGWQIDWSTHLASQRGTINLDGDRQHAGFQFRAAPVVAEKSGARFIRPNGFPLEPEAFQTNDAPPPKHIDLPWCAMTFEVDGQRATVAYLEDPALPKPSLFSERPYGRFGAFFKTTLAADKPLTMRYRVIVTMGESPSRDTLQKWFDTFAADLKRRNSTN